MAHAVDVLTSERPVQRQGRTKTTGYAAHSSTSPLQPFSFERREPGPQDVQIDILYCGVCHSDLHTARNEWTNTTYPVVPGSRDYRSSGQDRRPGAQIQGRRPRRGRLHGGFRPRLPKLPGGTGAVLRVRTDLHLQQRRQASRRHDLRRLLQDHRGGRSICAASSREPGPGGNRAAALRRHHDLLAPAALECPQRPEGRHRGIGRPRPHGSEAGQRLRRACRPVHYFRSQDSGRQAPGRA